jgi:hypothetical protein
MTFDSECPRCREVLDTDQNLEVVKYLNNGIYLISKPVAYSDFGTQVGYFTYTVKDKKPHELEMIGFVTKD